MTTTRVAQTALATLSHTFLIDETVADPGVVTYAVTDANGTAITDGTATGTGAAARTFVLTGQDDLARYTVAWTGEISGSEVTETDYVEIVGGFFFTLKQGRDSDSSLSSTATYPTEDIKTKRLEVEVECETICDRSFVPRYERVVLDGTGTSTLLLRMADPTRSVADVRAIRSVKVAPTLDETFVAFTPGQLAAVAWTTDGSLKRTDGGVFTEGLRNVVVEFEYGLDAPPSELVQASLTRLRSRLNFNKNGIPDRASSFTVAEGGTFRLDMPGAFKTGLPEVDAVYSRYSRRSTSGTGSTGRGVPASRTLSYDPQRYSLFHGGER